MKIAYLSTFYPLRGGIAQFNAALYRELEKEHQTKAYTFSRQYPAILFPGKSQYVTPEDHADPIPADAVLDTINPLTYYTTAKKIKTFGPDLVLTKFWMPYFAPSLGSVFKQLKNKSRIVSILDNVIPHEKRPGDMALTRFFLRQNHGFVVMSEAVKQDLLSLHPTARYLYHPHPLYDHFGKAAERKEARTKLHLPQDKKMLLFFGFIRDYKGLDLLINALQQLDASYELIIAGEVYGDFTSYHEQIERLGLTKRVHLHTRYISDDEVPLFFSAADVCVLPYKTATQSGITSIAYHFELPVIATDVGGLKEYILHQKTGLIVDRPDAQLIAEAINHYFDAAMIEQFKAAIKQLKDAHSWAHLAKEIIDFQNTL